MSFESLWGRRFQCQIDFEKAQGDSPPLSELPQKEFCIENFIPPRPPKSFRIVLDLPRSANRLDQILLAAIKDQNENLNLREISRVQFKELFKNGKILIKGQRAKPNSSIAKGVTYVDILGF